jgi:hypothetical protein
MSAAGWAPVMTKFSRICCSLHGSLWVLKTYATR